MRGFPSTSRAVLLAIVAAAVGCNAYDALFGVLEPSYTGGGVELLEKRRHFEDRIDAYEAYEREKAADAPHE